MTVDEDLDEISDDLIEIVIAELEPEP